MMLKVPLETWSLLKADPAMSFVGYVYGENQASKVNTQVREELLDPTKYVRLNLYQKKDRRLRRI